MEKTDTFILVDHLEGGWQIVRHCLRVRPFDMQRVLDRQKEGESLSGRDLYQFLTGLGVRNCNAIRKDDHLLPLPRRNERAGINIGDIIPCLQKFDRATGYRFLVKYSDDLDLSGYGLGDPLPGVAAHIETDIESPHHTLYIGHYRDGRPYSPEPAAPGDSRKAEEQCYYRDTGHVHWIRNSRSYGGALPLFETFDNEGHPLYLINKEKDPRGRVMILTEEFSETTGEVLRALRRGRDGQHSRSLSPEEIRRLPKPQDPTPLLG